MRTQKICIRISFYSTITSVVLLILLHCNTILNSILTGLFASALLSLFTSISTYLILRKQKTEALVITAHRMNNEGDSLLFSTTRDLSLEKVKTVTNALSSKLYELYIDNHELLIGMFWFNKIKRDSKALERDIERKIRKIFEIEFYIEKYEKEAIKKTKQIYKDLDIIISDTNIYHNLLKLSRKCNGEIYSLDEYDNSDKYKQSYADNYRDSIK